MPPSWTVIDQFRHIKARASCWGLLFKAEFYYIEIGLLDAWTVEGWFPSPSPFAPFFLPYANFLGTVSIPNPTWRPNTTMPLKIRMHCSLLWNEYFIRSFSPLYSNLLFALLKEVVKIESIKVLEVLMILVGLSINCFKFRGFVVRWKCFVVAFGEM